jgi:hypothetical protein
VVNGEEISAPQRTDVSIGFFILVPVAWGVHKYAAKLVLAQETPDGWAIRAVLDPDNALDANNDFMVDTDNLGNIHFLYFSSKGGSYYYLIFGGLTGAGGSGPLSQPELRYAEVPLDQLLTSAAATQSQKPDAVGSPWLSIKGTQLAPMSFFAGGQVTRESVDLRPLNRRFSVGRGTGEVKGFMFSSDTNFLDANREWFEAEASRSWVEVGILNGEWLPGFTILTADGLQDSGVWWSDEKKTVIRKDANGNLHALLQSCKSGFWHNRCSMNYFVKKDGDWSAPLALASANYWGDTDRSLAIDNSGAVFAAWVNEAGNFTGRWLRPHKEVPQE